MENILGLDLGTNSIGLSLRDPGKEGNIESQLDLFRSVIFDSGVGKDNKGEFSFAAERTKYRSSRKRYKTSRERRQGTLRVLIENGMCPLTFEGLDKWSRYDKQKGLFRKFPADEQEFIQWIRLDFDNDGIPEYTNPYDIRAEFATNAVDLNNQINKYKLGRLIYHIARRRGFKSSKGETLQSQAENENESENFELSEALKKSEEKRAQKIKDYMAANNLPTVGCALAKLQSEGERVRGSEYTVVRSQYKDELIEIFKKQNLDLNSDFCTAILSDKKSQGTIFYKRPLKSCKGLVGKCTLEKNKSRCPESRPEFEKFRALSLINNIKYREGDNSEWKSLSAELRQSLYSERFMLSRAFFKFSDIREWLQKKLNCDLQYKSTINYPDSTTVYGCPVTYRLKNLLGEDWENVKIESTKERINKKTGEPHRITYNYEDIWHICFSFDDPEYIKEFAEKALGFDNGQIKKTVALYNSIADDYAKLSLHAINRINPFLEAGFIYSQAVLLAKMPEILKDKWEVNKADIENYVAQLLEYYDKEKLYKKITNSLISDYKALTFENKFAHKNQDYTLVESDYDDIDKKIKSTLGSAKYGNLSADEISEIRNNVSNLYANFFKSSSRDYEKIMPLIDYIANGIASKYDVNFDLLKGNLYHPSMIEFYKQVEIKEGGIPQLGSPVIGAIRNPMAMRVLHTLRREINELLKEGIIDPDTRIVVETAREFNDANWRWAIDTYQKEREQENQVLRNLLKELYTDRNITGNDVDQARLLFEQSAIFNTFEEKDNLLVHTNKLRLWHEQNGICLYTDKTISLSELLNGSWDVEHTVPRSISFDNSLANLTICDSHFNRTVKKNRIPAQLNNYDEILPRIQPWIDRVERLQRSLNYWKDKSKRAQDKESKDNAIRHKHLTELELDYWQKKVNTFTMKEYTDGFRNNQLNDTRIITKYAYHYLRSLFSHVDVQKGSTTAEMRKALGVQKQYEKKDRSLHSHHAIDAAILTLIPTFAKKKALLETFYRMQENERFGLGQDFLTREFQQLKNECGIPNVKNLTSYIENNIIVKHEAKDKCLIPARRKLRRRGKVVTDADDKPIILTGDCIRGELHEQTFYGAIKQNDKTVYVVRKPLIYRSGNVGAGFNNWEELEKSIVDKKLFEIIRGQFDKDMSFKDACAKGIWMMKRTGNGFVRTYKIRHIRCVTSQSDPGVIKEQANKSKKEYKNVYYVATGKLPYLCEYISNDNKIVEYKAYNLLEVSRLIKTGGFPEIKYKGKIELHLNHIYKKGDVILIHDKKNNDLSTLSNENLLKRLYVIDRFENTNTVFLHRHNIVDTTRGKAPKFEDLEPNIRCRLSTIGFLILGRDFEIKGNKIEFNN